LGAFYSKPVVSEGFLRRIWDLTADIIGPT